MGTVSKSQIQKRFIKKKNALSLFRILSINSKSRVQDSESICSFGFGYTKSILWLWVYSGYTRGLLWVYPGFTLGIFWVYLRITSYVYSEYTILRVYLEYTMGILGVCYWYSLGNILGISWVYSRYTVDIPWLYYILLPLCMYSVPAM